MVGGGGGGGWGDLKRSRGADYLLLTNLRYASINLY